MPEAGGVSPAGNTHVVAVKSVCWNDPIVSRVSTRDRVYANVAEARGP